MGADDPDDRLEGPGWRDRLTNAGPDVTPWTGDDRLRFDRVRAAREPWHGVLCARIAKYDGQTLDQLTGKIGWFYLRLTRQEADDLVQSAKNAHLIELEDPHKSDGTEIPDNQRRWILTDKGQGRHAPRGAAPRDLLKRIVPSARDTYLRLKIALDLGTLAAGVLLIGGAKAIGAASLAVELIAITAILAFCATVLLGGLSDERALGSIARSWPRLEVYRPMTYKFQTTRLRTPGPVTLLASLTVLAILAGIWRATAHDELDEAWLWPGGVVVAIVLIGLIVAAHRRLVERAADLRIGYDDEWRKFRKPKDQR